MKNKQTCFQGVTNSPWNSMVMMINISEVQNWNYCVLFPGSFHALQTMMNGSHFRSIHRLCLLGILEVSQFVSLQKKQGLLSYMVLGTKLRSSARWTHSQPLNCLSLPPTAASQELFFSGDRSIGKCTGPHQALPDCCLVGQLQHPGWGASPQNPYLPDPHPKSPPATRFPPPLVPDNWTQGCFIHSRCPSPQPVSSSAMKGFGAIYYHKYQRCLLIVSWDAHTYHILWFSLALWNQKTKYCAWHFFV